jgi:hypothetical protein
LLVSLLLIKLLQLPKYGLLLFHYVLNELFSGSLHLLESVTNCVNATPQPSVNHLDPPLHLPHGSLQHGLLTLKLGKLSLELDIRGGFLRREELGSGFQLVQVCLHGYQASKSVLVCLLVGLNLVVELLH